MKLSPLTGKILYGLLFCAALPALLLLWASRIEGGVPLPVPELKSMGIALLIAGALLVLAAMFDLRRYGKGLPMNAYPPGHFVTRGVYAWFAHPIYVGAVICCGGASLLLRSAAGLYVVTPVLALLCAALVHGYEKIDLEKRFGESDFRPLLSFPAGSDAPVSFGKRSAGALVIFMAWAVLYEMLITIGCVPPCLDTMFSFEREWPVIEWTEIFYALTYVFVGLAPLFCRTQRQLQQFFITALLIITGGIFLQIILPFQSVPRDFAPQTFFGELILLERDWDGSSAAFPSFHAAWAIVAAAAYGRSYPRLRILFYAFALCICASCITTGIHSAADVLAGIALALAALNYKAIFSDVQKICGQIANSWREWKIGPLRIISHAAYAALAGITGGLIAGLFLGNNWLLLFLLACTLLGGALWGQFVEGSPRLLRPFGYYGSMIGGGLALLAAPFIFDIELSRIAASLALCAPFAQAAGRLRCLVQGCCHGSPVREDWGIRYFREQSRVCHISGMKGRSLHNTQLYSIVANIAIGCLLFRLWISGVPLTVITGLYFLLAGIARFVEEAYRGEAQTKIIAGLRVYQWAAVASMLAGGMIMCLPSGNFLPVAQKFDAGFIGTVLLCGLLSAFALSMDFPKSNARFSRLSG